MRSSRPEREARLAAALIVAAALAACVPEKGVGYVEVKAFPGLTVPLYLNTVRIAEMGKGGALLTQEIGRATLQVQRNGQFVPVCEFEVRKNRVVTVTISSFERGGARCSVKG